MLDIVTDLLVVIGYGYKGFDHTNAGKEEEIYLPYKTRFIYSATFLISLALLLHGVPPLFSQTQQAFKGLKAVLWLYHLLRNILLFVFWPIDKLIVKVFFL